MTGKIIEESAKVDVKDFLKLAQQIEEALFNFCVKKSEIYHPWASFEILTSQKLQNYKSLGSKASKIFSHIKAINQQKIHFKSCLGLSEGKKADNVKELIACQQLSLSLGSTQLTCDSFNLFHSFSKLKSHSTRSRSLLSSLIYINIDVII